MVAGRDLGDLMRGLPPQRPGDFNDTLIENFVPRPGGPVQNVDDWEITGSRFFETIGAGWWGAVSE